MSVKGAEEAKKFQFDTKPGPIDNSGRKRFEDTFGKTDIFKNLASEDKDERKSKNIRS